MRLEKWQSQGYFRGMLAQLKDEDKEIEIMNGLQISDLNNFVI